VYSVETERCMSTAVNQGYIVNFSTRILMLWGVCNCELIIIPFMLNIEFTMLCCRTVGLEVR